jgi:hypothetical protein
MQSTIWNTAPSILLLICLGSYGWGMRKFFVKPAGMTSGMRLTALAGTVCAIAHLAVLVLSAVTLERAVLSSALYGSALGLFWWAVATNRRSPLSAVFSPDLPSRLTQDGPYRFVRHPFYCSYMLTWAAGFAATLEPWLLPTVAGMLVLYAGAARHEEGKFSNSELAQAYAEYRRRTGLFVPNPWKLMGATRSR